MQQPRKSIARRALFLRLSLLALSPAAATLSDSHAYAEESVVEIAYSAPADCPTKSQFEQRLRARLGRDSRALQVTLSLQLTRVATHTRGELTITSGARSGARREVEAPSCEEAVDALTLVSALLIEPERTAEHARARRPASSPQPSASTTVGEQRATALAQGSRTASDAEARGARAVQERVDARARGEDSTDEGAATPPDPQPAEIARPPTSRARPEAPPLEPAQPARAASKLSGELLAATLLATGTMPAPRPGAEVRGIMIATWPRGLAAALELGARGLAPQLEKSPQGQARFAFYGGTAALCLQHVAARFGGSLCALAELGRLSARGRNTAAPRRAELFWRALGPALRASLRLTPRFSVALGAELLLPLARDQFELGGEALWSVPSLTFRGSLGVALRFE